MKTWEHYKNKDLETWGGYWNQENKKLSPSEKFQVAIKRHIRNKILAKEVANYINKLYPINSVILEAGSGTGGSCLQVKTGKYKIVAADLILKALKACQQNPKINYYVQSDIFYLPFKNNSLDGITNSGVMEHFYPSDNLKQLKEFYRVLKPKGSILLFWPSSKLFTCWIVDQTIDLIASRFTILNMPHLVWSPSRKNLYHLCKKSGFKDIKINISWTLIYFIVIARK